MTAGKDHALDTPTVEIVEVSPAIAEDWLSRNPTSATSAAPWSTGTRATGAGLWPIHGETVKLSADGQLDDGQHRLNAVAQALTTVPMVAVRRTTEGRREAYVTWADVGGNIKPPA